MPVTLDDRSERFSDPGQGQSATGSGLEEDANDKRADPLSISDRLYRLIALCYEATSVDGGWPPFAEALAQTMSATRCAAVIPGGRGAEQKVLWAHGGPTHPTGDWLPEGADHQPSPAPEDGPWVESAADGQFLIGKISGDNGRSCMVVAARPADGPDFHHDDLALLGELLPHIERALQVRRLIRESEETREALTEILDRLPEAIFLVDGQGTVISSNLTARAIAQQNDGLSVIEDRISIAQPNEQDALRALISRAGSHAAARKRPSTRSTDGAMTMSVSRPSGKTALPIVVMPVLCRGITDRRPEIVAAVITKDTERRGSVMLPDLAIAFGLTPGEKRLAGLVAGGLGLKEAAETLGITRNTVRTHMKRVYAKTGVHSQADLVRLLSRGSIELRKLETDG